MAINKSPYQKAQAEQRTQSEIDLKSKITDEIKFGDIVQTEKGYYAVKDVTHDRQKYLLEPVKHENGHWLYDASRTNIVVPANDIKNIVANIQKSADDKSEEKNKKDKPDKNKKKEYESSLSVIAKGKHDGLDRGSDSYEKIVSVKEEHGMYKTKDGTVPVSSDSIKKNEIDTLTHEDRNFDKEHETSAYSDIMDAVNKDSSVYSVTENDNPVVSYRDGIDTSEKQHEKTDYSPLDQELSLEEILNQGSSSGQSLYDQNNNGVPDQEEQVSYDDEEEWDPYDLTDPTDPRW